MTSLQALRLSAFALLAFGASACTFSRTYINPKTLDLPERVKQVEKGRTTAAELQQILGAPPHSILRAPSGEKVYLYSYGETKTAGLTLVVFNLTKTNSGIDAALFFVDDKDVVTDYTVGDNSRHIHWEWWPFGD